MSIVAKRSPISATADHLFMNHKVENWTDTLAHCVRYNFTVVEVQQNTFRQFDVNTFQHVFPEKRALITTRTLSTISNNHRATFQPKTNGQTTSSK